MVYGVLLLLYECNRIYQMRNERKWIMWIVHSLVRSLANTLDLNRMLKPRTHKQAVNYWNQSKTTKSHSTQPRERERETKEHNMKQHKNTNEIKSLPYIHIDICFFLLHFANDSFCPPKWFVFFPCCCCFSLLFSTSIAIICIILLLFCFFFVAIFLPLSFNLIRHHCSTAQFFTHWQQCSICSSRLFSFHLQNILVCVCVCVSNRKKTVVSFLFFCFVFVFASLFFASSLLSWKKWKMKEFLSH